MAVSIFEDMLIENTSSLAEHTYEINKALREIVMQMVEMNGYLNEIKNSLNKDDEY